MISFFICLFLLIGGYFVYGKVVENTFAPDDRETPAVKINDGVDYVVMPQWKLFLVQLLNIAGLGPIFGAMQGSLWGPVVFLWITFGTIFAGGVHDYFSGMLSERNDGASISEVCGIYLGGFMKNVMRVFSVVLLVMVGTVFAVGPAGLIVTLFKNGNVSGIVTSTEFWLWIILAYYFIATFISIDKIIGRIYPLFGICLIIMALGVALGIFTHSQYQIPEIWSHFTNMHPKATPIWSVMFITVACGAISGFHATQSPLMARCMKSEKQGHFVFYGAMVAEGIIDDQRQAVLVRDGCNGIDIGDIAVGVAQSFQIDGLGVGLDGILHLSQIVCVHKGGGDAELGQGVLQQVVAAAVDGLLSHDVVTGLCQCFDGVGDGSGTGGGCQSSHAALQRSDALLEHVLRGVGQAAVDVAGICQTKAVCCVLAVAEHIGSGLIDGHCAGIGCGIGLLLANVKLQGLKFIVRHSILPLYLYL